jgi:hypothetical protein
MRGADEQPGSRRCRAQHSRCAAADRTRSATRDVRTSDEGLRKSAVPARFGTGLTTLFGAMGRHCQVNVDRGHLGRYRDAVRVRPLPRRSTQRKRASAEVTDGRHGADVVNGEQVNLALLGCGSHDHVCRAALGNGWNVWSPRVGSDDGQDLARCPWPETGLGRAAEPHAGRQISGRHSDPRRSSDDTHSQRLAGRGHARYTTRSAEMRVALPKPVG